MSVRAEGKRKHTFYSHHLICDPSKYGKLHSSVQNQNICSVTGWQLVGPVSLLLQPSRGAGEQKFKPEDVQKGLQFC